MDKILDLTLAYPDFQLNQIIDPDQVDLNNTQIVQRVNEIAHKFNILIGNEGEGGSNITIKPLPQFPSAKDIQSVLEAIVGKLVSDGGAGFIGARNLGGSINLQELLYNIEGALTDHEERVVSLEDRASKHEALDNVHSHDIALLSRDNATQDNRLTGLETRTTNIEDINVTQSSDIEKLKQRDIYHDEQLAIAHSKNAQQDSRLTTVENSANTSATDITKIKQDIAQINTTNTNQEVVDARGSSKNLKERIDYTEIGIGSNLNTAHKVSMVVTDSNTTEFWEDKLPTASLAEHNADVNAHGGRIDAHNTSSTSHKDIREAIASMVTDWETIPGKPTTFPPNVHNHTKSQISDFSHTHTKSNITDFAHTHTKENITDFTHTHTKTDVGLSNVDNTKQMPISGGTFTGNVTVATNARLTGHIVLPIGKPATTVNGSMWFEY